MNADSAHLLTEQRLPESMTLDRMSPLDIVQLMNAQDRVAVDAVAAVADDVAMAVEIVVDKLRQGGRLIYVGAGTSGRLGVLDASECPPTFNSNPDQIIGVIAGGPEAMFRAKEGAEDDADDGAVQIAKLNVNETDAVCGITASGHAPFVHGALREAKQRGAATLLVACVPPRVETDRYDIEIRPLTGPEVLTGSTRLKAGTATKLVLNQLTTAAFVRLGKCYENLMIDVRPTNDKLWNRAARIVATMCDVSIEEASKRLHSAGSVREIIASVRDKT
ncbi:MAG TPA: N-acetylmuramic acid 6-phosphate etherase [Tepidisphaeraceae bacterium]|jgi:N-acetylmuramic acid 6-phosphate etherase